MYTICAHSLLSWHMCQPASMAARIPARSHHYYRCFTTLTATITELVTNGMHKCTAVCTCIDGGTNCWAASSSESSSVIINAAAQRLDWLYPRPLVPVLYRIDPSDCCGAGIASAALHFAALAPESLPLFLCLRIIAVDSNRWPHPWHCTQSRLVLRPSMSRSDRSLLTLLRSDFEPWFPSMIQYATLSSAIRSGFRTSSRLQLDTLVILTRDPGYQASGI